MNGLIERDYDGPRGGQAMEAKRMTRRQHLEYRRRMVASDLAAIDKAIAALDAHPELEEFIETLASAGA